MGPIGAQQNHDNSLDQSRIRQARGKALAKRRQRNDPATAMHQTTPSGFSLGPPADKAIFLRQNQTPESNNHKENP